MKPLIHGNFKILKIILPYKFFCERIVHDLEEY